MLKRSTESAKSSAPEIEMVPQELFWNYGRFIRREDNDRMKRGWRRWQIVGVCLGYGMVAACIIFEALR